MFQKIVSPILIAWGRTPVRWKWANPRDDLAWVRTRIARRYHPHWHSGGALYVSAGLYFFMLAAWPLRAIALITRETRRHATGARERTGRSIPGQIADQLEIAFRYGCNPEVYYLYELFRPGRLVDAPQFLLNNEIFALVGLLNEYAPDTAVEDKLAFNRHIRSHGLAVTDDIALVGPGGISRLREDIEVPPPRDFVVKPRTGLQGRGFACFEYLGDRRWRVDGRTLDPQALGATLIDQARRGDILLQLRLRNHAGIRDLSVNGLATARVLSGRSRAGNIRILRGVLKLPLGEAFADNFSAGSIASPIDLETGCLGPATGIHVLSPEYSTHPTTGAQIPGRLVPDWEAAKQLLRDAHALFPQYVLIAWDIGFTDSGPVIVEANRDMGTAILQKPGSRPLGASALPSLCRERLT